MNRKFNSDVLIEHTDEYQISVNNLRDNHLKIYFFGIVCPEIPGQIGKQYSSQA